MNNDTVDLLKIKIETAKRELPVETLNAINAIDWRVAILGMRDKHGYNFEQLGDLELETELVLCGLVSPEDYPKELEKRMGISPAAVNELMNEMNDLVFKKIREELIKNTEHEKRFGKREELSGNIAPEFVNVSYHELEKGDTVLVYTDGMEEIMFYRAGVLRPEFAEVITDKDFERLKRISRKKIRFEGMHFRKDIGAKAIKT